MSTQGPNSGGTFAGTTRENVQNIDWNSPSNAVASDNSYTNVSFSSGTATANQSSYLDVTNFGFSIPSGATINGVTVEVERKASATSFNPRDRKVQLIKGGTASGNNNSSVSVYPTSDAYATYGSASDLWGIALTDTDVNASTFGVRFQCQSDITNKSSVSCSVDHIRITITYTAGGGGGTFVVSSVAKTVGPIGTGAY